ncbi:hypothetical protein BH10BAC3_BH10BAC3_42000 [soil metagenome]
MLITLPDIRGEKEAFYKRMCLKPMKAAKKENVETDEPGLPPIINYWDEPFMKSFVEEF